MADQKFITPTISGHAKRRTGAELARFVPRLVAFQKDHPVMSFAAIARRFHISPSYAGLIFKQAGCKTPFPPKSKSQIGKYSGVTADRMVQALAENGSSKLVAARFGLTRSFVNRVLSTAGCETKTRPRQVDWEKIKALYEGGLATMPIARQFKIGHKRVRRELAERGVTIRPKTAWLKGWHAQRKAAITELTLIQGGKTAATKRKHAGGRPRDPVTMKRIELMAKLALQNVSLRAMSREIYPERKYSPDVAYSNTRRLAHDHRAEFEAARLRLRPSKSVS